MPDTYTSQFSGEEIDSILRAVQILSGASTPAELRKKLEIRGDTIPVSAEDSTLISDAVKYRTNPNLLDNWFFGRPVNQRDGYIPKDIFVKVYNDVTCTDYAGPVNYYPLLIKESNGNFKYNIGSNFFYIKAEDTVSGYANVGYTVDRWKLDIDIGTVAVESDGIVLDGGSTGCTLYELQEPALLSMLEGQILTFSAMYTILSQTGSPGGFGTTVSGSYVARCIFGGSVGVKNVASGSAVMPTNLQSVSWFYIPAGCKIKIHAVKVELGGTQTLAHKENGAWVMNEIPDFGDQLRRCMYYAEKIEDGNTPVITNATFIPAGATSATFVLPYERKRTYPSIRFNDVSNYRVIVRSMSGITTAFGISNISILDVGTTKASVLVTFSSAISQDWYGYLQRSDNTTGGYAFISADI